MKFEITEQEKKSERERILEAINYLLIKNPNIVYLDGDVLYDRKEKIYYDCVTGKILK